MSIWHVASARKVTAALDYCSVSSISSQVLHTVTNSPAAIASVRRSVLFDCPIGSGWLQMCEFGDDMPRGQQLSMDSA
eukprot:5435208-Pyramimonas_sp.AAC.2